METKKIAIGCFVGGVLCTAVALICTPMFWWLGLLAGMAGGYLGYEFREVLRAIPVAWRKSRRGVSSWCLNADNKIRKWSAEPHPVAYSYMIILVIATLVTTIRTEPIAWQFKLGDIWLSFIMVFLYAEVAFVCISPILGLMVLLAFIGSRVGEKCFWFPFILAELQEPQAEELEEKGYRRVSPTGKDLFRWIMKGIWVSILSFVLFFTWIVWKYLAIVIRLLLCFLRRFGWEFFKLIHSKKRVLCAIDGTIGGAIAFFCFASTSLIFPQQILVVFFGGLLGAVIGVLNYEIVSKRLLHLVSVVNNI